MDNPSPVPIEELLRHRGWVRCLARELVLDDSQVDDVEQLTWLAALERPPRSAGLMSWLRAVVRNTVSKQRRSEARRGARQVAAQQRAPNPAAADVVAQAELHEELVRSVRELEEPYRTTLLLRYFEDLPPRVIARRMDVPVATVRVRAQRGLERLRKRLDARHGSREAWHAALLPLASLDVATAGLGATTTGAFLMSTPTKLVVLGAAALTLVLGSVAWFAWAEASGDPAAPPGAGNVADGGTLPGSQNRSAGARTPVAQTTPASGTAGTVRSGAWIRVTRTGSGVEQPGEVIGQFVDGFGASHEATGKDGLLQVPDSLAEASAAAVLWLTTPDDHGLHRFSSRRYPEGITRLEIPAATGLRLRFVLEGGVAVGRQEIERRYAEVGLEISGRWLPEDRLHQDSIPARVDPPDEGLWLHEATFAWLEDSVLEVTNTPVSGRWRLLLDLAQAPMVLLNVPAKEREIEVVVARSPVLRRVRFVDAEEGEALANATVTPYFEHGDDQAFFAGARRRTDAAGELLIPVPPGVSHRGRLPHWFLETATHLGMVRPQELGRGPGGTGKTLTKKVLRKAVIRGRAFTPAGQPAVGALVVALEKGYFRRAWVDELGRYELRDVLPGQGKVVALATGPNMQEIQSRRANVGSGATLELDIGEAGGARDSATLRGRIVAGGLPLAGAALSVRLVGSNSRGKRLFTKTDVQGNYVLEGIPPGNVALAVFLGDVAISDDFGLLGDARELRLDAGATVVREFSLPEGRIQVQVLDTAGRPLRGVAVSVRPETRGLLADRFPGFQYRMGWCARTDAKGEVDLLGISPGAPMRVEGRHQESDAKWRFTRRNVVAGTQEKPMRLVVRKDG